MSDVIGTPQADATPSAPPATAPVAPAAPVAATPDTGSHAPATGAPAVEPSWLKQRLDETRQSAIRQYEQQSRAEWQRKEQEYQARLEQTQTQLRALVGVTPPQNPEVEAVRSQFSQLYPGLSKIEERAQQIMELIERSGDLESQTNHYWQSYGRQTMDRLFDQAQTSLGSPLTDEAKRVLHSAFTGFVSSSPEMTERYSSDPTLVEEFWKAFSSSFVDPARRVAAAGVAGRVPGATPQDTPGGAPRATPAPQFANADERMNAAWAMYKQNAKT